MKLQDLLNNYKVITAGLPSFDGIGEYSQGTEEVKVSTLSEMLLTTHNITEYYEPILPRNSEYENIEELLAADLNVQKYRIERLTIKETEKYDRWQDAVIVTDHKGLKEHLKSRIVNSNRYGGKRLIQGVWTEWEPRTVDGDISYEDIRGKKVIGNLPAHLVTKCGSYIEVSIADFEPVKDAELQGTALIKRVIINDPIKLMPVSSELEEAEKKSREYLNEANERIRDLVRNLTEEDLKEIVEKQNTHRDEQWNIGRKKYVIETSKSTVTVWLRIEENRYLTNDIKVGIEYYPHISEYQDFGIEGGMQVHGKAGVGITLTYDGENSVKLFKTEEILESLLIGNKYLTKETSYTVATEKYVEELEQAISTVEEILAVFEKSESRNMRDMHWKERGEVYRKIQKYLDGDVYTICGEEFFSYEDDSMGFSTVMADDDLAGFHTIVGNFYEVLAEVKQKLNKKEGI